MSKPSAVVATIPSDSHCWNLVFMELYLTERGLNVINLGACVPLEVVVETCLQSTPSLLVISTVNGHGYLEAPELAEKIRDSDLHDLLMVAGGKLSTQTKSFKVCKKLLLRAGFNEVFEEDRDFDRFDGFLRGISCSVRDTKSSDLWKFK